MIYKTVEIMRKHCIWLVIATVFLCLFCGYSHKAFELYHLLDAICMMDDCMIGYEVINFIKHGVIVILIHVLFSERLNKNTNLLVIKQVI